jgi:glc operon protein GlcG
MFPCKSILVASLILFAANAMAQTPPAPTPTTPPPALPYGPPITLQGAKKAMAAAELEAAKNSWAVAIAILDSGGQLVMLHRLDDVQHASIRIAQGKARTALDFRRETKVLEEAVARGGAGLRLLAVEGVTPLEGGVPIVSGGKIIGAIGVSGVASSQDAQIAQAGAEAAK